MPATVGVGYDRCFIQREARVRVPMRGKSQYANTACISFFKLLTSQLAGEDNFRTQTSSSHNFDRVVTKTSNLDLEGKKTWGIY